MDENRTKLEREIEACLNNLTAMSPDDKKYEDVINNLNTLYRLRIEEEKLDIDREEKEARLEMEKQMKQEQIDAEAINHRDEMELKNQQIKVSKRESWINLGIAGATIIIPLGAELVMYIAGMKFEETGTITSRFFQMMLNSKLFKHKK